MNKTLLTIITLVVIIFVIYSYSNKEEGMMNNPATQESALETETVEDKTMEDGVDGEMDDVMKKEDESEDKMMDDEAGSMLDAAVSVETSLASAGTYEAYAENKLARAESGNVVLFFKASWCPSCRTLDADIKTNQADIPAGVTILEVDYDKATALKQKYGVTTQHTLVEVDASGKLVNKWSGGNTLASVVAKL